MMQQFDSIEGIKIGFNKEDMFSSLFKNDDANTQQAYVSPTASAAGRGAI